MSSKRKYKNKETTYNTILASNNKGVIHKTYSIIKRITEETQGFEDDGLVMATPPRTMNILPSPNVATSWPSATPDWPRQVTNRRLRNFNRNTPAPTAVVYPQAAGVVSWPQPWGETVTMPQDPAQYPLAPVTTLAVSLHFMVN